MNNIADEITKDSRRGNTSSWRVFFILLLLILITLFIGDTLFGENSLEIYLKLKKERTLLSKKIDILQHKNAKLQRDYFELKSLLPRENE